MFSDIYREMEYHKWSVFTSSGGQLKSLPVMLLLVLFALVSVSLASEPGDSQGYYNWGNYRNRGYNGDDEQYYNTYNNYRSSEEYSKDPCATPKAVGDFNKYFADEVKNCELLTSVFNGAKNVSREEFKAAIFYAVSVLSEQTKEKPTSQALEASSNIVPNCKRISPDLLLSIYSNTAAKSLNGVGKLCGNNAQVLAQTYAKVTKEVAEKIVGENCPRSKMLSIIIGLGLFLERQGLYQGGDKGVDTVYSSEWKCEDKNSKAWKTCPIANYSPAKPGLKECDNVCKINDKAIDIFVDAFSNQVKNCKALSNVFNLQKEVTPNMFSRGTYYVDLLFNCKYNVPYPRESSDFQSRYIWDQETLKPCVVERVHSQFLAKYLLSEKILNEKNAEKLAEMYANNVKEKAAVFVDGQAERSKVVAIQTSWRRFLYSLDAISAEKNAKISYFYGNEWRCQA